MTQQGLFSYPNTPGYKQAGTSKEAAERIAPAAIPIRERVFAVLQQSALTADEVADRLGLSILTIRPRVAELNNAARIYDTTLRRVNASGHKAIVWTAAQAK